ncbi:MAG TPA: flagellar protein export ATPase FliI [Syntrophales bacterium]|nr:flagellar protein export ATPase FliI [Syntrophales bacterium]HOX93443.1 flagellar protein export ATPase FliI [Syntrophales bacterium]HPI56662.1 flagellar protein export ATPase FliI [Syntrophales bacterium]HPN24912.1 flagellar protein export ATPase FliI [Syntrophales bacterium]HQM29721.1 flagellar protein export ATPase FliI [Syntrophales bacterium]
MRGRNDTMDGQPGTMRTYPGEFDFTRYYRILDRLDPIRVNGKVTEVIGLMVEGHGPATFVGEMCHIESSGGNRPLRAEVVGFRRGKVLLMPLDDMKGIGPGCRIISLGKRAVVRVGPELLGRVLDGIGNPIDDGGGLSWEEEYPLYAEPINPLKRGRISQAMDLGIRSVNALLSCGKGQKMGIFSGSGVGKSILLGMIARYTQADVNVIALIGERGREVREFIEKNLSKEGLARSVVVVATSDRHPLIRMRAAYMATAIAEYFRDRGKDVLLMVDSLTRFAMAQREVGLSVGEPPATKGYTPSVFSLMPKLLERVGAVEGKGSITGLYNVLVEGDDFNEPISDAARSILDGHLSLSRALASKNHYPALDILDSVSRVMIDIVDDKQRAKANEVIDIMATYRKAEDLINIGAYVEGSNPGIDHAIRMIDRVNRFLRQDIGERVDFEESRRALFSLFDDETPAKTRAGARAAEEASGRRMLKEEHRT